MEHWKMSFSCMYAPVVVHTWWGHFTSQGHEGWVYVHGDSRFTENHDWFLEYRDIQNVTPVCTNLIKYVDHLLRLCFIWKHFYVFENNKTHVMSRIFLLCSFLKLSVFKQLHPQVLSDRAQWTKKLLQPPCTTYLLSTCNIVIVFGI